LPFFFHSLYGGDGVLAQLLQVASNGLLPDILLEGGSFFPEGALRLLLCCSRVPSRWLLPVPGLKGGPEAIPVHPLQVCVYSEGVLGRGLSLPTGHGFLRVGLILPGFLRI
jgi:hypothetical protein